MPNGETTTLSTEEAHECFVFISNKLASDITLTIGQAFDLAYRLVTAYPSLNFSLQMKKKPQQLIFIDVILFFYNSLLPIFVEDI